MNTSSAERCDANDDKEMLAISSSPTLLSVLFIQATFSIAAQPLLMLAIRNVFRMALIHRNTKIILIAYLAAIMLHSMARILLHTTDLVIYLSPHESGCEIIPSPLRCFIMRMPLNFSIFFACSSTFMIAMERLVSTYKAKSYESNRSVGFLLLGIQFVVASALFGIMYSATNLTDTNIIYYCHATSVEVPARTIAPISTLIVLQVSAVAILKVLERVNRKKSVKQRLNPDLRVRYNVGENLRTIKIVIPFCYASCVFTSIFLAIMCLLIFFHYLFTKAIYFALVDGSMLLPMYGLVLPIIIKRMNARVNEKSNSEFQRHITPSHGNEVASMYFDSLSWAWKGEINKKFDKIPKFSAKFSRIKRCK